jgi:hypothetical protein
MARPAAERIPAGSSSRVPAGASQLGAGQLSGAAHIRAGQLRPGQKLTVPERMPIVANISVGEPAFDQVSRTVREINNMVPV